MSSPYEIREFACALCGNCCRGAGFVRIQEREIDGIAGHLGISRQDFLDVYCQPPEPDQGAADGEVWLVDKPGPEQECVFLENNRCRIHPVKPEQCRGFPLKWRTPDIMDYCEGMRALD